MRAAALGSIASFVTCIAMSAQAAERNPAATLKQDTTFGARWDRCEALARRRGTPPATIGYGDFIEACMGRSLPKSDSAVGAETTGAAAPKRPR
jgi:hypothetical protein